jgi:hypothetical protein
MRVCDPHASAYPHNALLWKHHDSIPWRHHLRSRTVRCLCVAQACPVES